MKQTLWILLLLLATCEVMAAKETYKVSSPSKKVVLELTIAEDGTLTYSFTGNGKNLIKDSHMGYATHYGATFPGRNWFIASLSRRTNKGAWTPVWGKRKVVPDCFNALTLRMATDEDSPIKELDIEVRAYDDGAAFRFLVPESQASEAVEVEREITDFCFTGDYTAWYYNGERHNLGPEKLSKANSKRMPVMTVEADKGHYMALHEADLRQGFPLILRSKAGSTDFHVEATPSTLKSGFRSAWRVLFYGDTPGAMVDSHLIELLNPDPCPNMDFSWVKPGVCLWDWRINGAKVDGFTYGMNYPSWLRMVDFAAEEGFISLVLDANWYGPEFEKESDPTIGDKAREVRRLIDYAKKKGVGIWLYLNDVGGRQYPIEETLKQYGEWGAAGVKYGFMSGTMEEKNLRTKMITELCAKNKLLVDYHDGPVHPYGQMRTWPNALSREFNHAQLDAHRVFQPTTMVTTVFVNMLAGPLDMNNGMFDLRAGHTTRVDESQPVPSTLASEAARTLITFSGATILPDIPEYYKKYPSLLRFISAQKMPWVESRTLRGEIGEYIVMMRETEESYLVGGAVNEEGTTLSIPLNFLPKGETFEAELTKDGKEAHYIDKRETIEVEPLSLKSTSALTIKMAPGGGFCLLIKKTSR